VVVPGDISSAAFFLVAASIIKDAHVTVQNVGVNPTRTGLLEVLQRMGAQLSRTATQKGQADRAAEPVADVTVTGSALTGVDIGAPVIPWLIDEVPVLAVAGCLASGITRIRDAAELRVKESDRILTIATALHRMGADVVEQPDGLEIRGGARLRGTTVASGGDHRIAMALVTAALVADGPTVIEDTACIATSFPGFAQALNALAETPSGAPCVVEVP
jgi:3-phosphoshikimate 1-carboxyvinyltransferase